MFVRYCALYAANNISYTDNRVKTGFACNDNTFMVLLCNKYCMY